jgi:pimeloyl-ACP methyl ester carboxylesterase
LKQMDSIKNRTSHVQTHIVEDCRHSPHVEQPEKVLDIMTGFIDEVIQLYTSKKGRPLDRDK